MTRADRVEKVTHQFRRGLLLETEYRLTLELILAETADEYEDELLRLAWLNGPEYAA